MSLDCIGIVVATSPQHEALSMRGEGTLHGKGASTVDWLEVKINSNNIGYSPGRNRNRGNHAFSASGSAHTCC